MNTDILDARTYGTTEDAGRIRLDRAIQGGPVRVTIRALSGKLALLPSDQVNDVAGLIALVDKNDPQSLYIGDWFLSNKTSLSGITGELEFKNPVGTSLASGQRVSVDIEVLPDLDLAMPRTECDHKELATGCRGGLGRGW